MILTVNTAQRHRVATIHEQLAPLLTELHHIEQAQRDAGDHDAPCATVVGPRRPGHLGEHTIGSTIHLLTPAQHAVATRMRQHFEEVVFGSTNTVAVVVATSPSQVTRVAQALGYDGFPAMQRAAADEFRRHVTAGGTILRPVLLDLDAAPRHALKPMQHAPTPCPPIPPGPVDRDAMRSEQALQNAERAGVIGLVARRVQDVDAAHVGRPWLTRAVVRVAHARGAAETRDALVELAVRALAWAMDLDKSRAMAASERLSA